MRLHTMKRHLGPNMTACKLGRKTKKKSLREEKMMGSHRGLERNKPRSTIASKYWMRLGRNCLLLIYLFMARSFSILVVSMLPMEALGLVSEGG